MGWTPYLIMAMRSIPNPKAKPEYSSGSIPTARNTFGSTMPQPPSSIQLVWEHTRQPAPSQKGQLTAYSAEGSVKGKNDGNSRDCTPSPKYAVVKAAMVPERSPKVMPRSTARPSIWWNTCLLYTSDAADDLTRVDL